MDPGGGASLRWRCATKLKVALRGGWKYVGFQPVTRLHLILAGLLLILLAAPVSAGAANSAVYDDRAGDAVYPGIDIKRIGLTYADSGFVGVGVATNYLIGGNRLAVYLDVDLNPTTGWQGADYALFYEQYISGQSLVYGVWNGSAWQLGAPSTLAYEAGEFGVNMVIHASEIGSPSAGVNVFARGGHANVVGTGDSYWDTAPDVGSWRLDFSPPPTAVGGTGGPAAPPIPVAALTVAEARSTARRGLRRRTGRRAKIAIGRCARRSPASLRCKVTARRGNVTWKGRATVVETVAEGRVVRSFAFRGIRTDRRCRRGAKARAGRGNCTSAVRW